MQFSSISTEHVTFHDCQCVEEVASLPWDMPTCMDRKKNSEELTFLEIPICFFFLTISSEDRKNKVWIKIQITLKNDSRSCMKSKWRLRLVNQSCKLWGKSWSNVKEADGFRFNVEKNSLHTVCQSKKIMTKENTMTVTKYKMHLGSWKLTQHLCN